VAAHGNSLRSLIMAIEGLSRDQILKRELETGVPTVYKLNANSTPASVDILSA
jgi:2,3-bisphosphoglycerate-dependent phosphoglycerate mutase